MNPIHANAIVIDGLIISKWNRAVFEDMRKGGLSAANCTVSVWEDFKGTVHNIADMKAMIRDNAALVREPSSKASVLISPKGTRL